MTTGIYAWTTAALALALTACGGGDGVGSGGTGITLSSVAIGSVESLGGGQGDARIVVNGVHFDISKARVEVEDASLLKSGAQDLKPGMTVQVRGTMDAGLSTGTATHVLSVPELRGAVDAVDAAQGRLDVMGVRVYADGATVFDGLANLADLQPGHGVQVHALPANGGLMRATRVQILATTLPSVPPVLWGKVQALDTATRRFQLGSMQVQYGQATFFDGLDAGLLANGMPLYVHAVQAPTGGVLAAGRLRPAHALSPQEAPTPAALSGLVTDFTSLRSFALHGTHIDASGAEVTGGTGGDIGNGAKLEVAGRMSANGVLLAQRIHIRQKAPDGEPGVPAPGQPDNPKPGQPGGNPNPGQPGNPNPGQPGGNPNPGQPGNPNPGQPGGNPNPGQPGNPDPGQPGGNPNPGQPGNPDPGQPGGNPNPGQPGNPNPGQPGGNPNPGQPGNPGQP